MQFVNILDFMMVMPLGPDFAKELGIPMSHIGWVGGAYTAAAAVSGVVASFFLDRFDRRSALAVAMGGLVLGTAAGGAATGFGTLIAARVAAGTFGGPATSLSLSIIADVIPPARRGRAMGAVMGAFSVASVLGVPAGLELARLGGWRLPFWCVAGLGLAVAAAAILLMPRFRAHLDTAVSFRGAAPWWREPAALCAIAGTATMMTAAFSVIPNVSAFMQFNLAYPRARLGLLYMVGGAVSFFAMRAIGRLVDRFGSPAVAAAGTALFASVLWFGFAREVLAPMTAFVGFMLGMSFRNVPLATLSTRVPRPHQRAGFMSAQSAVQHLTASVGAVMSSVLLAERPDLSLAGMRTVASVAIGLSLALPVLLIFVQRGVAKRESAA